MTFPLDCASRPRQDHTVDEDSHTSNRSNRGSRNVRSSSLRIGRRGTWGSVSLRWRDLPLREQAVVSSMTDAQLTINRPNTHWAVMARKSRPRGYPERLRRKLSVAGSAILRYRLICRVLELVFTGDLSVLTVVLQA